MTTSALNRKDSPDPTGLIRNNDGFLFFSRDIHYCMNRDGIFGCTKPIVDSLYEVLHNGRDGEVANAPPVSSLA
jgi:hypothetical protein